MKEFYLLPFSAVGSRIVSRPKFECGLWSRWSLNCMVIAAYFDRSSPQGFNPISLHLLRGDPDR